MLVATHNISILTARPAFCRVALDARPSKAELVEKTCVALSSDAAGNFNPSAAKSATRFARIVYNPPEGFDFVPVLFVAAKNTAGVRKEYNKLVLEGQYKRLATLHAAALLAGGGVSAHGLKSMLQGRRPTDKTGRREKGSLDHIVSVEDCGEWAATSARDPLAPQETPQRFLANHTGNFVWMADWIHHLKNQSKMMQRINNPEAATDMWWGLDLVPIRNERYDGFVSPPQPMSIRDAKHIFQL